MKIENFSSKCYSLQCRVMILNCAEIIKHRAVAAAILEEIMDGTNVNHNVRDKHNHNHIMQSKSQSQ